MDFFESGIVEKLTPENMGVDAEIMVLSDRIAEIERVAHLPRLHYKIRSALRGLITEKQGLTGNQSGHSNQQTVAQGPSDKVLKAIGKI